ncbi:MAG: DUF6351 family protein [Pseudomonadota bacterium]
MTIRMTLAALAAGCLMALGASAAPAPKLKMEVLSSPPQYVTGGDARIAVTASADLHDKLVFWLNGQRIAATMASSGDRLEGLVSGLRLGPNTLEVRHRNGQGLGVSGAIQLTNHPITGPVFSGPQLRPFECRTVQSGLGAPLDAQCSVTTRFDHFYRNTSGALRPLLDPSGPRPLDVARTTTSDGRDVPFIVRVESGTINRSIYRIAVLDDPQTAGTWNPAGWNRKLIFTIGESTGAQYHQGVNRVTDVLGNTAAALGLASGHALIISTQHVNKLNPNDVLAAEGLMMLKEHFIEQYGVPTWVMGYGGSGGAIQQMLIAQNYPGLLNGILPNAAFPDVFGTAQSVADCRLLNRYFIANPVSDAVRKAFEGFAKSTCNNWDLGNGDAILATGGPGGDCGLLDKSLVYHPVTNPGGARCTIQDVNANSFGRDPATGFARRPLDNVGIQYGLLALRQGRISTTQFLDLNERVGGYDIDGNRVPQRSVADAAVLARAYELGRVVQGGGGLATVPIMHARVWAEIAGDIHTAYNDVQIRAKLMQANGRADNQVVWVLPHPQLPLFLGGTAADVARLTGVVNGVVAQQFVLMSAWLDALAADPAPLSADKVARLKPAPATDACWDLAGTRVADQPALTGGACNALYAKGVSPRMAAGAPVTDDVLKCQLKPVDAADYAPVVFSAAEQQRLAAVFPGGVCDHGLPGVSQRPLVGTWLRY